MLAFVAPAKVCRKYFASLWRCEMSSAVLPTRPRFVVMTMTPLVPREP